MEESDEVAVSGGWNWVLEALSMSNRVDLRLLYGLIKSVPPQILGNASEAAAFRCLEALSGSASVDSPNTNKQLHFPPSLTSQHVLQRFCHQTDHLQKDATQELRSSIHAFVNLKKPTLPISNLELLKNMILQGNHPFLDGLRPHSGLFIPSNSAEILQQHLDTCSPTPEINDHLPDVNISNGTSEHLKSDTNGYCIDNHMHGIDTASQELDNFAPLAKKLKLQKQPQHSVFSDDMQQDSNHPLDKTNETCGGDSIEKAVIGQPKTSTENDDLPNQTYGGDSLEKSNQTCGGDSIEKTVIGQPKTSTENDSLPQIGATMGKVIFSSSQCKFNEDPITLTDTEPNLCMKCNEGGQLLSCSSSTCPLFFHENCLGCFVSFDDHGNFYCPICAYSSAVSDYVKAKDKMSLMRKQLTLFIGGESSNLPKHDHLRSLDDTMDQQRHENRENAADGLRSGADTAQVAKSH